MLQRALLSYLMTDTVSGLLFSDWAVQYSTGLLNTLTPKGMIFSFLSFLSIQHTCSFIPYYISG